MKNNATLRSLLHISQADMARLLKVHRSQLSMFELGKRDLPRQAKLLLAPMLAHVTEAGLKPPPDTYQPVGCKQVLLTALLLDNEFERLRMTRKLEKTRKYLEKKQAALSLTTFLSKSTAHKSESHQELIASIKTKVTNKYGGCDETTLLQCEIKCELLELERQLLEEQLAKHHSTKK
jgi:transcriptional regulator with XRE-family HTH domain